MTPEAQQKAAEHRAAGGHPVRMRTDGIGDDDPEDRGLVGALPAGVQHRTAVPARRLQQQRADRADARTT